MDEDVRESFKPELSESASEGPDRPALREIRPFASLTFGLLIVLAHVSNGKERR